MGIVYSPLIDHRTTWFSRIENFRLSGVKRQQGSCGSCYGTTGLALQMIRCHKLSPIYPLTSNLPHQCSNAAYTPWLCRCCLCCLVGFKTNYIRIGNPIVLVTGSNPGSTPDSADLALKGFTSVKSLWKLWKSFRESTISTIGPWVIIGASGKALFFWTWQQLWRPGRSWPHRNSPKNIVCPD